MPETNRSQLFGKRKRWREHTIIIASGDRVRHFTLRPWMAGLCFGCIGLFAIGYLGATAYLFLRDDLLGAVARQTRTEQAYEGRINALRTQIDRVTSRQLVDQQKIEERVRELYERQVALSSHQGRLSSLLGRARSAGLLTGSVPLPRPRPDRIADGGSAALEAIDTVTGGTHKAEASLGTLPVSGYLPDASIRPASLAIPTAEDEPPADIIGRIDLSLRKMETDQADEVHRLTSRAVKTASAIRSVIDKSGLPASGNGTLHEKTPAGTPAADDGVGGPYIRISNPGAFDKSLVKLNKALDRLESIRAEARKLPFGRPLSNDVVTSPFGRRSDPFLEKMAFHSGVDLRAARGTDVRATGAGTVIAAGRARGYGNMVEIDHGDGVTTRYGHLSQILVDKGEHVAYDAVIGKSGSTGRSTGPHLHYEVRLNGHPVNPMRFLSAGLTLRTLMGS